jgi:uracil-DNA glycosylase
MNFEGLVTRIRKERNLLEEDVPGFDHKNGNERAKYLFLLEAPGPQARISRKISYENDDPTARNLCRQLAIAGMCPDEIALWNIVPWYLGNADKTSIRAAKGEDIRTGMEYLKPLIAAMPNLLCIILVGQAARQAHVFLSRITPARIVACHHPSQRVLNSKKVAEQENIEIFKYILATTRD